MKLNLGIKATCASMLAVLSACAQHTAVEPYPAAQAAARVPAANVRTAVAGQRTAFDNVDTYKYDVAEQIMRYNGAHTFSGKLPPMLPAIVVLSITVDQTGKATNVSVQRSRDQDASKVALASMQRAGQLPRPFNLATGPGRSLTFSETFLFNADYRFQLRTLAPIQTSD
jgi:protein TonB